MPLTERLPVYERYLADGWCSDRIEAAIDADDEHGARFRAVLAGETAPAP